MGRNWPNTVKKQLKVKRGTGRALKRSVGANHKSPDQKLKERLQREALERATYLLRWVGGERGHYEMRMPDGKWESRANKSIDSK